MSVLRIIYALAALVGLTRGRTITAPRRLSTSGSVNGVLGGLRGRVQQVPGQGSQGEGIGSKASATLVLTGTNNDLKFTSRLAGQEHNVKRVRVVVAGNSTPLSVSRTGDDFTINSATDGAGVATSTANQVIAAWRARPDVNTRLDIANAVGNDGTGVVAAIGFTALTGGA